MELPARQSLRCRTRCWINCPDTLAMWPGVQPRAGSFPFAKLSRVKAHYVPGETPAKRIHEILTECKRTPPPELEFCCLCVNRRTNRVGVFSPTESFAKRIGKPKDKQRIVIYGLCNRCAEVPDFNERVEEQLLRDEQVQ